MDTAANERCHHMQKVWDAEPEDVKAGKPDPRISPTWNLFLLSNGSPTRHMQLLTSEQVVVKVLAMSDMESSTEPHQQDGLVELIEGPRVRRQVLLQTASGKTLGYAVSWWSKGDVDAHMTQAQKPIWVNILNLEHRRDILGVYRGACDDLAKEAQDWGGDVLGRHYILWHNNRPLTLIYEIFNVEALSRYLGPVEG
eukprot:c14225_g1_i1.p1 GENE.c14225_g1_i1~~c14225_g1_i1.p1  ORF type:complete len:197 (+),score=30.43 c14225_g1_i1:57-647(+)